MLELTVTVTVVDSECHYRLMRECLGQRASDCALLLGSGVQCALILIGMDPQMPASFGASTSDFLALRGRSWAVHNSGVARDRLRCGGYD